MHNLLIQKYRSSLSLVFSLEKPPSQTRLIPPLFSSYLCLSKLFIQLRLGRCYPCWAKGTLRGNLALLGYIHRFGFGRCRGHRWRLGSVPNRGWPSMPVSIIFGLVFRGRVEVEKVGFGRWWGRRHLGQDRKIEDWLIDSRPSLSINQSSNIWYLGTWLGWRQGYEHTLIWRWLTRLFHKQVWWRWSHKEIFFMG